MLHRIRRVLRLEYSKHASSIALDINVCRTSLESRTGVSLLAFKMHVWGSECVLEVGLTKQKNAVRSSNQPITHSSLQTLVFYFLSSPLYVLRYPLLFLCSVSSLTSFIFRRGYPYWFVGLGVFLELGNEVVKVLLFLFSVLQRSLLQIWIVFLLNISA